MKFIKSLLISACLVSATANAGLITNGSFEVLDESQLNLALAVNGPLTEDLGGAVTDVVDMGDMNSSGDWGIFASIPGWQTLLGQGLELQYSGTVADAQDGNIYMEMDTNPELAPSNVGIMQEVNNLVIGTKYRLSFYTQARTATLDDNKLNVLWFDALESYEINTGDEQLFSPAYSGSARTWVYTFVDFVATSEDMKIAFTGAGNATGKGALLDNISLVEVPEPHILALMLIGLAGFSLRRKS